jgi:hypothetical protein
MDADQQYSAVDFIKQFQKDLIPLGNKISWFSTFPVDSERLKQLLEAPCESLPPDLASLLPRLQIFLVPYLEGRGKEADTIVFAPPSKKLASRSFQVLGPDGASLVFAAKELSASEFHYEFFTALASLSWELLPAEARKGWKALVKGELSERENGEVDEIGWKLKNQLLSRQNDPKKETSLFRDYLRAAFLDSFTLYLHSICCDVEVEPSPRLLPSWRIRKRLELLRTHFPLPEGYVLFPEELSSLNERNREPVRRLQDADGGAPQPPSPPEKNRAGDKEQ